MLLETPEPANGVFHLKTGIIIQVPVFCCLSILNQIYEFSAFFTWLVVVLVIRATYLIASVSFSQSFLIF